MQEKLGFDILQVMVPSFIKNILLRIPHEGDRLFTVQNEIIYVSLTLSISVIGQAVIDIVLEFLSITQVIDPIPFRLEFLFLTLLSGLLGYFTLSGIRKRHIDLTRSSLITSFFLEISLISSDIYYLFRLNDYGQYYELIRTPFVVLTSINVLVLLFIIFESKVFTDQREYINQLQIID